MPKKETLRQSFAKRRSAKKQSILDEFSGQQVEMEGMLNVKERKRKLQEMFGDATQPIKDYLMNFSNAASIISVDLIKKKDSAGLQFAQSLKQNLQTNMVKTALKVGVNKKMTDVKRKREREQDLEDGQNRYSKLPRKKSIFETLLTRSLFQVSPTVPSNDSYLKTAAKQIEDRFHYNKRFK